MPTSLLRGLFRMLVGMSGDCPSFRSAASCGAGAGAGAGVDASVTVALRRPPSGDRAAAVGAAEASARAGLGCFALPPPRDGPRPPRPLPFDPASTPLEALAAGAARASAGCESCPRSRGLAPSCHSLEEGFEVSARCASGLTVVLVLVLVELERPLLLAVAAFCCLISLNNKEHRSTQGRGRRRVRADGYKRTETLYYANGGWV